MASMTDIKAQWDQKLTAMSKTLFKDARGTLPESCLWLSDQNLQNPESTLETPVEKEGGTTLNLLPLTLHLPTLFPNPGLTQM